MSVKRSSKDCAGAEKRKSHIWYRYGGRKDSARHDVDHFMQYSADKGSRFRSRRAFSVAGLAHWSLDAKALDRRIFEVESPGYREAKASKAAKQSSSAKLSSVGHGRSGSLTYATGKDHIHRQDCRKKIRMIDLIRVDSKKGMSQS